MLTLCAMFTAILPGFTSHANASPTQQAATSVKRDVTYCTAGGVDLKMDLYLPAPTGKSAPTVVYVHGGSWISGDKFEIGGSGPALAAKGYVIASVNYRLAPDYKWPAQIDDVKCAVRSLRANAAAYNIDPNRIAAWGSSAGGHLVAMLGLTTPAAGFDVGQYLGQSSAVQAVVDMFGPTDFANYNLNSFSAGIAQEVFGITPDQSTSLIRTASPVTYVTKNAPPFYILHGDKDTLVPFSQSQELLDKLHSVGAQADLVVVHNAGHAFVPTGGAIDPTLDQIATLINAFFDRTIGNAPAVASSQFFAQTGQAVSGLFLQYWQQHGALAQFGYPISAQMQEKSAVDGNTYTVQYFQRATMELHPENSPPNNVLLSLLGALQYKQKYPNGAPAQVPNNAPGSAFFQQTGHRVGGAFLQYRQQHGGLAQQGYPISDELKETSPVDGKQYTVQYFERAVFEYHPENKPPYDVLLSQLGTLQYKAKYGGNK